VITRQFARIPVSLSARRVAVETWHLNVFELLANTPMLLQKAKRIIFNHSIFPTGGLFCVNGHFFLEVILARDALDRAKELGTRSSAFDDINVINIISRTNISHMHPNNLRMHKNTCQFSITNYFFLEPVVALLDNL
jgi:hypothetical protein